MRMDFTGDCLSTATAATAVGHEVICLFVNDTADRQALMGVSNGGAKMIALR
jgi:hypothetical protein